MNLADVHYSKLGYVRYLLPVLELGAIVLLVIALPFEARKEAKAKESSKS